MPECVPLGASNRIVAGIVFITTRVAGAVGTNVPPTSSLDSAEAAPGRGITVRLWIRCRSFLNGHGFDGHLPCASSSLVDSDCNFTARFFAAGTQSLARGYGMLCAEPWLPRSAGMEVHHAGA